MLPPPHQPSSCGSASQVTGGDDFTSHRLQGKGASAHEIRIP
jgi:hypothetical protein